MGFLCFLGIVIVLAIDFVIAKKFEEIAEMKGHIDSTYFWFTFLFGLVGMLMVIALPIKDKESICRGTNTTVPPQKDIFASVRVNTSTSTVKRCPDCGDIVKSGRCEMCGKEVK